MGVFSKAMVSPSYLMIAAVDAWFGWDTWERHRREADKLGIDMDINDQFMVVVTQAKWVGRTAMRLASQASVMEVEQVEQAMVPTVEMRGASSEAVSVTSSTRKVSSDAIGLSHWANQHSEGSGRGQGGCSSRVRHHQAQGLGASSTTGRHRRCLQYLQEGRGCGQMCVWDWHGLRPMQVGQAVLQLGTRAAWAEEAHQSSGKLGGGSGRCRDDER